MPVGQKLVLEEAGGGARVEITSLAETETVGAKIGVEVAAGRFVATVVLRHRA